MYFYRLMVIGACFATAALSQGVVPPVDPNFCINGTAKVGNLACVLPNLFYDPSVQPAGTAVDQDVNARGITLAGAGAAGHTHHFADFSNYSQNLLSLNVSIATQLTSLPLPSTASGFVFVYDKSAGVQVPNPRTLGSILTERAENIGAKRVLVGTAYQRFRFGNIDDQSLRNLSGVFSHESGPAFGAALQDYVTTRTSLDLKIDQFIVYGTVGVTNLFDISVALPINDVRFGASAAAHINRVPQIVNGVSTTNLCVNFTSPCHFFAGGPSDLDKNFSNSGSATGIGDVTLRLKHSLHRARPGGTGISAALLTDVRFPTGDARNFLGSGAYGIKPFLALSAGSPIFSPHFNIGYQINGSSILAGDVTLDQKHHLPNQFFYAAGGDVGVVKDVLTVVADYLGQYVHDGARVINSPFTGMNGDTVPRTGLAFSNYSMSSASIGAKFAFGKQLLLTANLLFRLDDNGLRQRTTPLIGLSYTR